MKSLLSCCAAAALLFTSATAQANLLSNASFESPIDYSGAVDGNWSAFFGGGSQGTFSTVDPGYSGINMPADGAYHLSMINATEANGFSGVQQRVPVSEGIEYTFDFVAKRNGEFNIAAEFRLEWFDGGGNRIGGQFDLNTPIGGLTESYQPYSLAATAPAGATDAIAVIAVQTFIPAPPGGAGDFFGDLFVDATSVTGIPEPTSAMIALLGLAPLARRRR